jgi:hypothetical protein
VKKIAKRTVLGGSLGASLGLAKDALTPEEAKAQAPGDLGLTEARRRTEAKRRKMAFELKRREFAETLRQLQWAGPGG